MKNYCPECGDTISKKNSNYRYKESGIDNVYLQNIPVYECSCGISYPSIFRLPRLNELVAKTLLEKPALLNGKEIRFLRKNLHLSATLFSKALSIRKDTFSKWENDIQQHSESNDRLIRATYIILKGIDREDGQKLLSYLAKIQLEKPQIEDWIIAEKVGNDYVVSRRLNTESHAQRSAKFWTSARKRTVASAKPQPFVMSHSQTESDFSVSSWMIVSTETTGLGNQWGAR